MPSVKLLNDSEWHDAAICQDADGTAPYNAESNLGGRLRNLVLDSDQTIDSTPGGLPLPPTRQRNIPSRKPMSQSILMDDTPRQGPDALTTAA